jgi:hypothetical protein
MQDHVTISVCSEAVVLQTSYSRVSILRDQLSRSRVLREAVENCKICSPVEMYVPAGFTQALGQLLALDDQIDASPLHGTPSNILLLYVMVCHHVLPAADGMSMIPVHHGSNTGLCILDVRLRTVT